MQNYQDNQYNKNKNQSSNCRNQNGKNQLENQVKNDCGKGDAKPNSDKQNDKYLK